MGRLLNEDDVYALFALNGTARLHVADIDVLPRVDAVEMVHGQWIGAPGSLYDYCCSNCQNFAPLGMFNDYNSRTNYCPNCGAKMDSEG